MKLVGGICSLALLAAVLLGAAGGHRASSPLVLQRGAHGTLASTDVFRLEVSLNGKALEEEWISPGTGDYSIEIDGTRYWLDGGTAMIYRQSDGTTRALYHGEHAYLRAASSGSLWFRPGGGLVGAYLSQGAHPPQFTATVRDGHTVIDLHDTYPLDSGESAPLAYRVTVAERVSLAEARRRGLFGGSAKPLSTTWQSRPGTGSRLGLTPYWAGPRSGKYVAVLVEEKSETKGHRRSYLVRYSAPTSDCAMRDGTAGKNGWWPGVAGDTCNTRQITTWPAGSSHWSARATKTPFKLAGGEAATLIRDPQYTGFYVRTRRAVIDIRADELRSPAEQLALARTLRPVRP